MGLFALVTVGGFLAAAFVLVALFLAMARNLWRTGMAWPLRLLTILATLPLFALPAFGLWKVFNSSDMLYMRGYFGLAPKTQKSFRFPVEGNETLAVRVTLDFNTGAKGGAIVGYRFSDEEKGRARPIAYKRAYCPFPADRHPEGALRLSLAEGAKTHKSYGDICLDLYFDPALFGEGDFRRLARFLATNHAVVETRVNDYLDHQKEETFERMWLRDAYYLDPGSLRR